MLSEMHASDEFAASRQQGPAAWRKLGIKLALGPDV
jgi:hypothetical protein